MARTYITDYIWNIIVLMLPPETGGKGRPCKPHRNILEGIIWRLRTGAPWRDVPEEFGPWQTIYTRFHRWSRNGLLEPILKALTNGADTEWIMIDATVVRAHQHAAGAKGGQDSQDLGRSRGGFSTKIHAVVDAHGNPLEFDITAGQVSDFTMALPLLEGKTTDAVIADKGYDSDNIREKIIELDAEPVIPYRKSRKEPGCFDKHLYGARHAVENFFAKLKQFRSAAFRYDKTSISFRGMLTLACILIWARL